MARPQKDTVTYFPHQCVHKESMFAIKARYKNDGYAAWFQLLELLGNADGHYLRITTPVAWEYASTHLGLEKLRAQEILDYFAEIECIDRELWRDGRTVWCQNFVDGVADTYKNRRRPVPTRPGFLHVETGVSTTKTGVSTVEMPQTKLNETKPKETRTPQCPPGGKVADVEYSGEFQEFWACYPRRIAKFDAFRQWKLRLKEGRHVSRMVEAARNYALACEALGKINEGIKHPATFLGPGNHIDEWQTEGAAYLDAQQTIKARKGGGGGGHGKAANSAPYRSPGVKDDNIA